MCKQRINKTEHNCKQELIEVWNAVCVLIVVMNSIENIDMFV